MATRITYEEISEKLAGVLKTATSLLEQMQDKSKKHVLSDRQTEALISKAIEVQSTKEVTTKRANERAKAKAEKIKNAPEITEKPQTKYDEMNRHRLQRIAERVHLETHGSDDDIRKRLIAYDKRMAK